MAEGEAIDYKDERSSMFSFLKNLKASVVIALLVIYFIVRYLTTINSEIPFKLMWWDGLAFLIAIGIIIASRSQVSESKGLILQEDAIAIVKEKLESEMDNLGWNLQKGKLYVTSQGDLKRKWVGDKIVPVFVFVVKLIPIGKSNEEIWHCCVDARNPNEGGSGFFGREDSIDKLNVF